MKASINQKINDLKIENVRRDQAILRSFRQQEAIFHITLKENFNKDWDDIVKVITEQASHALGVERTGIWLFNDDNTILKCTTVYLYGNNQNLKEEDINCGDFPRYFSSLEEDKVLSIRDVTKDKRIQEFYDNYLKPNSIQSLIDAPIKIQGIIIGVVCFESVSVKRIWTKDEDIFAERIAEEISLFIVENERKKQEKVLNTMQNYLVNIIDSMPSEIITVDSDCVITQWNRKAEMNSGITAQEAIGKRISYVLPFWKNEELNIIKSIKTGLPQYLKKREKTTNSGTVFEDITISPLSGHGQEGAVIRIDDTTDIVHMEEILIQSEKMLSVGGLAAGMAHEINNPLAGMMQTASVLANRLGEKNKVPANRKAAENAGFTMEALQSYMEEREIPRMISIICESGRRIALFVDNMLSFARKSDGYLSAYSINDLLDKTFELAETDYDLKKQYDFKQIKIVKEYDRNLPPVPCEGSKIQQVILNILRNGAEAMFEAGVESPCFIVRTYYDQAKSMICFEIEDNGPGMKSEIRKRIFEPFFTTKPVGIGTGLGLSVSYFIITENHKGNMSVESHDNKGSVFIIQLPVETAG
jgi:PAS domain S-box-containing protein